MPNIEIQTRAEGPWHQRSLLLDGEAVSRVSVPDHRIRMLRAHVPDHRVEHQVRSRQCTAQQRLIALVIEHLKGLSCLVVPNLA